MELRPHDPADRITKVTTAAYDPKAHGPTWDKFSSGCCPTRQCKGSCSDTPAHRYAAGCWSTSWPSSPARPQRQGRLYGAMIAALGDYASVPDPDLFLHRDGAHPTGEMDLRGRRFVVVAENDKDRKLAEATVKRLTGGDRIKAR